MLLALLGSSCSLAEHPDAEREPRSVLKGELLAIFPGFFVHGLGHRYAGNRERADEILAMEGYSVLTAAVGGGIFAFGEVEDVEAAEIAGLVALGVGGVGFLGTWLYDIVFTPSEIRRANERAARGE